MFAETNCHRLRDDQVLSIQMVCIHIYDVQKVGKYHELQRRRICHCNEF